ncbi:unnamed protein product [Ambrosiozyma monospora]|uniref:Unnamed protein product n=1 Tax=Ambrosiozyma monospora TaxID=43982 RepID=A0ACB5T7Z1_AMBMO|nr:unnamed protein product [Ambrosiozyma monospora]
MTLNMTSSNSISVTVEYFGPAKQYTNDKSQDNIQLDTDSANLNQLLIQLTPLYNSDFVEYIKKSCGLALNGEYQTLDRTISVEEFGKEVVLTDGSELVIVPPVSGG